MAEPWESAPEVHEDWMDAPTAEDATGSGGVRTKSGEVARNLRFIDYAASVPETVLAAGTGMAGALGGGITYLGTLAATQDPQAASYIQQQTQEALTYEPRTEGGKAGMELLGKGMQATETGVKFVGSGYAALAGGPQGQRDFMATPNAISEGVYRATGSPSLAAGASVLPEAVASVVPAGRARRAGGREPNYPNEMDIPEGFGGVSGGPPRTEAPWRQPEPATPKPDFSEVQGAIQRRNPKGAAEVIRPNPVIVAAFDELGIEYSPGMVSENPAFRQVQSGMKSKAESGLSVVDENVWTNLKTASEELVNRYGTTDRSVIDADLRAEYSNIVSRLQTQSDEAYAAISKQIPAGERVNASHARNAIERRISELGAGNIDEGLSNASKYERSLWNLTHKKVKGDDGRVTWQPNEPSYAAIDAFRKDIGRSIEGQGPFRDSDPDHLRNTYALVAEVQQRAANAHGVGRDYRAATELVAHRKSVEDAALSTLGRNLERGAVSEIDSAANALVRGDAGRFSRLMSNVPESLRQQTAAAVLNNLFAPGAQKGGRLSEGFIRAAEALNRNTAAKDALFSHLPAAARRRFDTIYEASRGFFRSMQKDNRSNTANANDVLKSINDGSLFIRGFGLLRRAGARTPMINELFAARKPNSRTEAADRFLRSQSLNEAVREYARGRTEPPSLTKTPEFNKWLSTLSDREVQAIQSAGVVAFLVGATEQANQ